MENVNKQLLDALKFYADKQRYMGPNQRVEEPDSYGESPSNTVYLWDVTKDWGDIARKAIAAAEEAQPAEPVAPGAMRKIGTLPVKDRYFLCRCEKCGWIGSSEECRESINHMHGDGDYYCPSCGANGPDEMASAEATFNAMLSAASQAADPIKRLIAMHNELLGEYPYCYFELAYTRRTDWMAWLCTKPREDDPERKVLACGQGLTAEEACAEAISAAQKGGA